MIWCAALAEFVQQIFGDSHFGQCQGFNAEVVGPEGSCSPRKIKRLAWLTFSKSSLEALKGFWFRLTGGLGHLREFRS